MPSGQTRLMSAGFLFPPAFDVLDYLVSVGQISVAALYVAEIILVRLFVMIANAVFWNDCAEPELKTVNDRRPHATGGHTTGHDDCIDPLARQKGHDRRLKKD